MSRFACRRLPLGSLLLVGLFALPPSVGEVSGSGASRFRTAVLGNGLTVSVLAVPGSPLVATQVWYHVGSAHEGPGRRGLAHLFEHLMFGATADHDAEAFALLHERHGGYENAYTTPDETVYLSVVAPDAHARVLEMEASRMRGLRLTEQTLDNERRIVAEELRLTIQNDPLVRAYVAALASLLGEHPYAVTPVGTPEDIEAATLAACEDFRARYYGPGNAHLVIVGVENAAETLRQVRDRFGSIPAGGEPAPSVPPLLGWPFPSETVVEEDLPPAEIALVGFPLPPARASDRAAVDLLLELLARGPSDPIREALVVRRDKALDAGTEVLDLREGGALVFYSVHLPYRRRATAFRLLDGVREGLDEMDWLSDERLASAKRRLVARELDRGYFVDRQATALGQDHWWRGDASRALERVERIRAVGATEVAAAYRRYVQQPQPVRLYLEPESVPLWIRLFGWLYPLVA